MGELVKQANKRAWCDCAERKLIMAKFKVCWDCGPNYGKLLCTCDWCGKKYYAEKGLLGAKNTDYCSAKCRSEAGAGNGGGDDRSVPESSSSESSSSESEPMLSPGCAAVLGKVVTGVVILMGLMFSEGLCAEGVDERGLKGYTWEERMEFKRKELGDKATTPVKEEKVVDMHQKWVDYLNTIVLDIDNRCMV